MPLQIHLDTERGFVFAPGRGRLTAEDVMAHQARRAIVVPDTTHYGVTRQVSALGGEAQGQLEPLHTIEEACEWLGLPEDAIPRIDDPEGEGLDP